MEEFVRGDVVVLPFPFTDLSATKKRPALVISVLEGDDLIVCQITGQVVRNSYVVELGGGDIVGGRLDGLSYIRPNKVFTSDKSIICYKIGKITPLKMKQVEEKLSGIIFGK